MLGHLLIDPQLAVLCDKGAIEEYNSETFEEIAREVVRTIESA
jgi:hypothetical protein